VLLICWTSNSVNELLYGQRFVFATLMCYRMYAISNTIVDIENQVTNPTPLAAYDPKNAHVVLESVQAQGFSEAVCRLQLNNTPICG